MIKYTELDGKPFAYEFEWKRIKNINLRIRGDGTVYVSAPYRVSMKAVDKFIDDHKDFIIRSLSKVEKRNEKTNYASRTDGSPVRVYGKVKTLRIEQGVNDSVTETDDEVIVSAVHPDDEERINKVYNKWRSKDLETRIYALCNEVCPVFNRMGAPAPSMIRFKTLKSKWGSCDTAKKILTFNYNLFETPEECVRYVVVHEFAHLIVPNHSDRFYRVVSKVMSDWQNARRTLNEY